MIIFNIFTKTLENMHEKQKVIAQTNCKYTKNMVFL